MYLTRSQALALAVLLSVSAVGGGVLVWRQAGHSAVVVTGGGEQGPEAADQVVVHVCGAVKNPGVYILPAGSRVYEAVAEAGGALPGADQEAINMAAPVRDGEQVFLPYKSEMPPLNASEPGSGTQQQPAEVEAGPTFPLHLNQATESELQSISGIGPTLAARIVEYRTDNGPYTQVDDLLNVNGIGAKTLERLRPYLVVP